MKIKTSELTGAAFDWAVAKCEGHQWRCPWMLEKEGLASWSSYEAAWGNPTPPYSTEWSQGGPIIEREGIATRRTKDGKWYAMLSSHLGDGERAQWALNHWVDSKTCVRRRFDGPTQLVAAMRCYVASKLGDEVEVPEGLCNAL